MLLQPGTGLPEFTGHAVQINESVFIVEADLDTLRWLAEYPSVVYVEAPRPMGEDLDTSVPATKANVLSSPPSGGAALTGLGVVVGFVDRGGMDWKLEDFQVNGHTRILAIWDQSLRPVGTEKSPAAYGYGVEYDKTTIDGDLAGGPPLRHRCNPGSHATHVAGIAVGNGSSTGPNPAGGVFPAAKYVGVATNADIIYVEAVKIPGTTLTSSDRVAEAIKYIFEKAGKRPCVVNVSLGNNGGAHDSESVVERTIDRMLEANGRVLVKSAGNEVDWDCHAVVVLTAGDPRCTLEWQFGRSGRHDRTPNELELWSSSRDRFRIWVEHPQGSSLVTSKIIPGADDTQRFPLGNEIVTVSSQRFHPLNGASYVHIHVDSAQAGATLSSGVWKVCIEAHDPSNIKDGRIDAWIERDLRDAANNYADQSLFRNFVAADGTLNPPGTIRRGITVGNYDHLGGAGVSASGRGPTRDGRNKPDLVAPGFRVWSSGALGNQPNPAGGAGAVFAVRVEKTGTSMSAPHVTGVCAQLLEAFPAISSAQMGATLVAAASALAPSTSFDNQLGFGLIDAKEADTALR
uniref:S8 family serine peptidase n=1 Tax=Bradyrhizobium sp. (strain ORS 278) TaxID=114615 RepID=UPI000680C256|nr:S8 family serine peptidase [Bradyrhizobium sp. ORS 278]